MTPSSKNPSDVGDGGYLGRTLDERYRLDEVIGAGAIGKVYAGTQLAVDRKVAIKLLHPAIRDRELGKERFLREAKAVARLSHSSCLTLFDFGSDEELGCFYMVTEFVEGTTLAREMQHGQLPVDRAYHVLYHAATALQHAHERGILHRDLKPENIMLVGEDGVYSSVKVLDFGLARIREGARPGAGGLSESALSEISDADQQESDAAPNAGKFGDSRLTAFGELNGTPAYMSPEQCRGDLNLTQACDYYSLGVLAYELIEGRLPFESSVVNRLLSMHLNDPIPQMVSGRASQPIEDMIYRLLAKDPAHRLQSADEILDTLRPYITVDPSREMSRASLERLRRETPPKGQSPQKSDQNRDQQQAGQQHAGQMPVAESGAETLVNYDGVDTPIPRTVETLAADANADGVSRDSAFGTMLAADLEPEDASKERGRTVALVAGLFVVLIVAGVWWLSRMPEGEPVALEESRAVSNEEPSTQPPEESSLTGAVDPSDEEAASSAGQVDEGEDEGPVDEERPEPSSRSTEATSGPPKPPPAPSRSDREEEERQRPRKLELTY